MTTTDNSTIAALQQLHAQLQDIYEQEKLKQEQYAHGIDPLRQYGQGRYADGLNTALGYIEAAINRAGGEA